MLDMPLSIALHIGVKSVLSTTHMMEMQRVQLRIVYHMNNSIIQ